MRRTAACLASSSSLRTSSSSRGTRAGRLGEQVQLCELEAQGGESLLAARSVHVEIHAVHDESQIVAMRADERHADDALLRGNPREGVRNAAWMRPGSDRSPRSALAVSRPPRPENARPILMSRRWPQPPRSRNHRSASVPRAFMERARSCKRNAPLLASSSSQTESEG